MVKTHHLGYPEADQDIVDRMVKGLEDARIRLGGRREDIETIASLTVAIHLVPKLLALMEQLLDDDVLRRASADVKCPLCNRTYGEHPFSYHRDFQEQPFLRRICDGTLVKL